MILKLSESSNASANQVLHTVVNGQTLGANQVLHSSGGSVSPVTDPGASAEDYTVTFENNGIQVPQNALYSMELNTIYPVDIYFYLEGCDPDCSESITLKQADLFLAFYGVISQ